MRLLIFMTQDDGRSLMPCWARPLVDETLQVLNFLMGWNYRLTLGGTTCSQLRQLQKLQKKIAS